MSGRLPILEGFDPTFDPENGHVLLAGASGTGKTRAGTAIACRKLRDPRTALIVIDPEGEIAADCYAYAANPKHGLRWRKIHYLKPASTTHAFALPLLHVPTRDGIECHNRALRALTIFSQFFEADADGLGIRISKYFYLGTLGLGLTGRPLVALPELYNLAGEQLREVIASHLPYRFLADAWTAIDQLNARTALEYRDPIISRLQPVFGNPALRRVFGPQPPLDIAAAMRNREVVLLDLSGLEHKDAVLVGKALFSLVYHEALQREPNRAPHVCVLLDEAFDYLSNDVARGFDRLRKRNVQLIIAIQRMAQLDKLGDADSVATLSAVMSGTRTKLIFRLPEPDDADYAARLLFSGHLALNEWKPGTERPVIMGYRREIMRSRSTGRSQASHVALSESESVARGISVSRVRSVTEAEGESVSDGTSEATAIGATWGEAGGSSSSVFESAGASQTMTPPPEEEPLFLPPPEPVVLSVGESTGVGTGHSTSASWSSGESSSRASGSSHARSSSRSRAISEAESESTSEVHGFARGRMRGTSKGRSESEGESESLVPIIEWMPSQTYSLSEQLHRLSGEIQNLALREVFVKVDNAAPVRTRTATTDPAFATPSFKRLFMPLFHRTTTAKSACLFPVAEVDALIEKHLAELTPLEQPEPDFAAPEFGPMDGAPRTSFGVIKGGGRRPGDNRK